MLESSDCVAFKPLEEGKMRIWPFLYTPPWLHFSSSPWLQSPVHRPAISRQKPTQTGSRRARLFHTNFKQVMYRQGERERGKNRFREKPNTIEAKKQASEENGIWMVRYVFASLHLTASLMHTWFVIHNLSKSIWWKMILCSFSWAFPGWQGSFSLACPVPPLPPSYQDEVN